MWILIDNDPPLTAEDRCPAEDHGALLPGTADSVTTVTGTSEHAGNDNTGVPLSTDKNWRRHLNNWFALMPCSRATAPLAQVCFGKTVLTRRLRS